jgi:hypothetical protein
MQQPINTWLKENSWNLIITVAGIIIAFSVLNFRVEALEKRIAEYPSQDWFELKFDNIDEKIDNARKQIDINTKILNSKVE